MLWEQDVEGSNPAAPTMNFIRTRCGSLPIFPSRYMNVRRAALSPLRCPADAGLIRSAARPAYAKMTG